MLPQEILDGLRLLLRPFWDSSRIVVATWLADNSIKFLAVHVHLLSQLTWISMREGTTVSRTAAG